MVNQVLEHKALCCLFQRGYVWGPMAQLTYWGLQNYAHVPAAATAKAALCKQMNGMMLEQWRNHGYICGA